ELDSSGMTGFIKAYFSSQNIDQSPVPMRFCRPQDVPVTAALARSNTVCDRWFASLPDDTQPNRLMSISGYSLIDSTASVKPPLHLLPDQTTIFDWLESKGIAFEICVDAKPIADVGVPSNLLLMKSQWRHVIERGRPLDALLADWKDPAKKAPGVIYCEPFYNDFATVVELGMHGNCNHAPLPMAYGEDFLRRVYGALTSNSSKWAKTVLIICYDEHGGFFDHVPPPNMPYAAPPGNTWVDASPFSTLGVRIPGLVVSPLVEPKSAFHGRLDHTSILQLMVDRFGSAQDLAYFGQAPLRKANQVVSLADVLTRASPRLDVLALPSVALPASNAAPSAVSDLGRMFRGVIADQPAKGR
ncbi:MAG TPA: alkaline phosphatase family protein, partial [Polyangiaceae bacterium]|nr:alkaline phosphatase family protein [Polyangiaceae bacterium]